MSSSICLEFPGPYAGAVIGKAGRTLKGIQGASGATLQLSQPLAERYAPDGTPNPAFASSFRTLRVSATSIDSIHAACDRVVEVLRAEAARKGRRSGSGGSSGGGRRGDEAVTVVVPSSTARMLQATTDNRGAAATSIIGRIRASSGAAISAERRGGDTHDWRLVCSGGAAQAREAMRGLVEAAAGRETARHEDFLARNWPAFATDYSDHFETPRRAYEHIAPVLAAVARQQQQQQQQQHDEEEEVCQKRKRKRSRTEVEIQSPSSSSSSSSSLAPSELLIYDPYYCLGRARALLASVMGYRESSVINANRDFYADVAAGAVPRHGVLVTNPPYSAEHKQRLLGFLLDQQRAWWEEEQRRRQRQRREAKETKKKAKKGKKRRRREEDQGLEEQEKKSKKKEKKKRREEVAERENNDGEAGSDREGREDHRSLLDAVVRPKPFLLLMPAWVAAGEFWRSFLRDLAALRKQGSQQPPHENEEEEERRKEKKEGAALEREAGVFYVCPTGVGGRGEAYQFDHAEGTQRGECPFFGAWFCGGWVDDGDRRRAMASLKAARRQGEGAEGGKVEVFRSTATMQRRGHFDARGAVTQGLGTGVIAVASKKI